MTLGALGNLAAGYQASGGSALQSGNVFGGDGSQSQSVRPTTGERHGLARANPWEAWPHRLRPRRCPDTATSGSVP